MTRLLNQQQPEQNPPTISAVDFKHQSISNLVPETKKVGTKFKPTIMTIIPTPYKSVGIEMASGWVGGAVGIAITHPLDSIRVMKQYQTRISKNNLSYFEIFKRVRDTHGFAGFWRGVIPPSVFRGLGLAANRAGYSLGMQFFKEETVKGTWRMWVIGSFAGICGGVIDMPIYLLKCRAQVKVGWTRESFSLYALMLKKIWMYEGISAFTNGLIPQLLFTGTTYAAFYAIYDYIISSGYPVLVAGMIAGTVSWPLGIPFDSLRVRMQCQPYNVPLRTVVKDMWRQPIQLWFTGLGATMLRAAPRWGVTMLAIESCNKVFKDNF